MIEVQATTLNAGVMTPSHVQQLNAASGAATTAANAIAASTAATTIAAAGLSLAAAALPKAGGTLANGMRLVFPGGPDADTEYGIGTSLQLTGPVTAGSNSGVVSADVDPDTGKLTGIKFGDVAQLFGNSDEGQYSVNGSDGYGDEMALLIGGPQSTLMLFFDNGRDNEPRVTVSCSLDLNGGLLNLNDDHIDVLTDLEMNGHSLRDQENGAVTFANNIELQGNEISDCSTAYISNLVINGGNIQLDNLNGSTLSSSDTGDGYSRVDLSFGDGAEVVSFGINDDFDIDFRVDNANKFLAANVVCNSVSISGTGSIISNSAATLPGNLTVGGNASFTNGLVTASLFKPKFVSGTTGGTYLTCNSAFTGSTTGQIFYMEAITSTLTGQERVFVNRASVSCTISGTYGQMFVAGAASTSLTVTAGQICRFICDGTYWVKVN